MTEFLQQLINGLSLGAIYALIALGYTMIYGVLRFVNFAHGDVFMVGAYAGFYFAPLVMKELSDGASKLPWIPPFAKNSIVGAAVVLVFAMITCAIIGVLIEKIAYRPLRNRPRLTVLITAIGVSIFLEYTGQFIFGANPRYFPELIETQAVEKLGPISLGDLTVTNIQLLVFVVALGLLFLLRIIVMKTRMGMAMRALSVNPTACSLMGVNNDTVVSFTFGLGSALAAAGGILYALMYPSIDPLMGILVGLKAFVAAVLGGIGNIPGAALGGCIIGVVETMVIGYGDNRGALEATAIIVAVVGFLWTTILAFRKSLLWGLGVLLIPGASIIFWGKHWSRCWVPCMMVVTGACGFALVRWCGLRFPSSYRDGVAFAILILILLVKPTGIFGKSEREKV